MVGPTLDIASASFNIQYLSEEILIDVFADLAFATRNHGSARKLKTADLLLNVKEKNVNAQLSSR